MSKEIDSFVEEYVSAIRENSAALFAGAGLSIPAGFVDWKKLLKSIASDIGLNVDKESDLVAVAQYHVNKKNRHKINNELLNQFTKRANETENHKIIASLPIKTIWTTNYDELIEQSFLQIGKIVDVKHKPDQLPLTKKGRSAVLYKMHGDANDPVNAVLTRDDYENYPEKRGLFTTALQGDLVSKTFLFLGFSFADPNINYILSRVRVLVGEKNQRKHYCIMRRVVRKKNESLGDFKYSKNQMDLYIDDLKRYGIETLLVDDYKEITVILKKIKSKFNRHRVLISGSASSYSEKWGEEKSKKFIHELSLKVLKNGYDIASGFGLGVGSAVINGALEFKQDQNISDFNDRLILHPFPQFPTKGKDLPSLWKDYREDIIKDVGIVIFIFGNKIDANGNIINADGVRKEFEIAKRLKLKIIPVGATGWMSEDLWKEVLLDYENYYGDIAGLKTAFQAIGKKEATPSVVITNIIKILEKITKE